MRIELCAWSGLDGLRSAVLDSKDLLERAGLDPLAGDPLWIVAHAEAFLPAEEIFGWTAVEEGRVLAFAPFRREPSRGLFALRRGLFASDGTFDSDYLDLAVEPGREREVVPLLLEALSARRSLDAVVLSGIPETSPCLAALRRSLVDRRLPSRERPVVCLAAALPASFSEYVGGLKPRTRSKVRQALRRAEEEGARCAWCAEDLELHLTGLYELHGQRWSEAGQSGSFADERRRNFFAALALGYASRNELRFSRLEWNGRSIAYQFGVRRGATYYQLQEGYLPEIDTFRGATALRAMSIERLIDEGVRSYDFLAGEARHKRDWGAVERPCTTVAFALPRWRARAEYALKAWLDRKRS